MKIFFVLLNSEDVEFLPEQSSSGDLTLKLKSPNSLLGIDCRIDKLFCNSDPSSFTRELLKLYHSFQQWSYRALLSPQTIHSLSKGFHIEEYSNIIHDVSAWIRNNPKMKENIKIDKTFLKNIDSTFNELLGKREIHYDFENYGYFSFETHIIVVGSNGFLIPLSYLKHDFIKTIPSKLIIDF
ncbi:hypothetical protein [Xenorhabdus nematophila]|uniref:hypothetical protein n=1 Tax=Xenorhabdus nematophila TaxID=628 RepID=UPI00056DC3C3|nr:hypothetical protein [Xenorhabdus nematophila]KHD27433.1 hypothetical protein LH67_18145 [Xenorhabdus nematophila]